MSAPSKQVFVLVPTKSPTTGRQLGWGVTHAVDCKWALSVDAKRTVAPYSTVPASQIPPGVGRCSRCGGGR